MGFGLVPSDANGSFERFAAHQGLDLGIASGDCLNPVLAALHGGCTPAMHGGRDNEGLKLGLIKKEDE